MYRMHAEGLYDRKEQRCEDQDRGSNVHNDLPEGLQSDVAIQNTEDQSVYDCDRRALCGCENAGYDAADHDDDQGQSRNRIDRRNAEILPVKFALGSFIAFAFRKDHAYDDTAERPGAFRGSP